MGFMKTSVWSRKLAQLVHSKHWKYGGIFPSSDKITKAAACISFFFPLLSPSTTAKTLGVQCLPCTNNAHDCMLCVSGNVVITEPMLGFPFTLPVLMPPVHFHGKAGCMLAPGQPQPADWHWEFEFSPKETLVFSLDKYYNYQIIN